MPWTHTCDAFPCSLSYTTTHLIPLIIIEKWKMQQILFIYLSFFFDRITTNSNAHIRFEYIWALVMRCTLNRLPSAEENCTKNKNESLCSRRCCTVAWLVVKPQNRKPHITKHDIQRVKGKSTEALILFFSLNFSYGVGCDIVDVDSTHTHRQRRSSCMRTRKICLLL